MDGNHQLDAPNNDELKNIEQIEDRSGLSTLYREPGKQFEGDLMSQEEREKAKTAKQNAITNGIGKHFLKVGILVPYPLVSAAILLVVFYSVVDRNNAVILATLIILAVGAWMITSYQAYRAIFRIFYKHALRAGPFLVVALLCTLLGAQAFYSVVADNFATQSLLYNVALTSLMTTVYSLVITSILLGIWGTTLTASVKAIVSATFIAISGFLVALTYLI